VSCLVLSGELRFPNTGRLTLRWRRLLPLHHLPDRLPFQAAQGQFHNEDLPPEHQREWIDLLGHLKGPVVACIDHLERCDIGDNLHSVRLTRYL
jgi:hypothetical protein